MRSFITLLFWMLSIFCLYSQQEIKLCDDGSTTLTYNTSSSEIGGYQWYVDSLFVSTEQSVLINWINFSLGSHVLTVYFQSTDGCDAVPAQLVVSLVDCDKSIVHLPNSFTPDSDNLNNSWYPVVYNVKSLHYLIYNRWGELIFTGSTNSSWDGTFNKTPCKQDVYVCKIEWQDKQERMYTKFISINLIR